jgi:hypothetical protein
MHVYNSTDKAEQLERRFERAHYLTLDVGTANHSCMVNRTVSNSLRPSPPPNLNEARLRNPYEFRRAI